MEDCPRCGKQTLVYDPHTKGAHCLRLECDYYEGMSYCSYSDRFEGEEKNMVHKLSFRRTHSSKPVEDGR